MTGNTTFFEARHDICRPATPSTRLAGAMGLPEPVRRGKIGSNRSSSGECRVKPWADWRTRVSKLHSEDLNAGLRVVMSSRWRRLPGRRSWRERNRRRRVALAAPLPAEAPCPGPLPSWAWGCPPRRSWAAYCLDRASSRGNECSIFGERPIERRAGLGSFKALPGRLARPVRPGSQAYRDENCDGLPGPLFWRPGGRGGRPSTNVLKRSPGWGEAIK